MSEVYRERVQKRENTQWAAAFWVKTSCWCQSSGQNRQIVSSWYEGDSNSNNRLLKQRYAGQHRFAHHTLKKKGYRRRPHSCQSCGSWWHPFMPTMHHAAKLKSSQICFLNMTVSLLGDTCVTLSCHNGRECLRNDSSCLLNLYQKGNFDFYA